MHQQTATVNGTGLFDCSDDGYDEWCSHLGSNFHCVYWPSMMIQWRSKGALSTRHEFFFPLIVMDWSRSNYSLTKKKKIKIDIKAEYGCDTCATSIQFSFSLILHSSLNDENETKRTVIMQLSRYYLAAQSRRKKMNGWKKEQKNKNREKLRM